MKRVKASDVAVMIVYAALILAGLYSGIAFAAFEYRNPKANTMSYYRDFRAVMTWQVLDKYQ